MTKQENAKRQKADADQLARVVRRLNEAAEIIHLARTELMALPIVDSETGRQVASLEAQAMIAAATANEWRAQAMSRAKRALENAGLPA